MGPWLELRKSIYMVILQQEIKFELQSPRLYLTGLVRHSDPTKTDRVKILGSGHMGYDRHKGRCGCSPKFQNSSRTEIISNKR